MTKSETNFRLWIKKNYPGVFIKKIPDFKQAGVQAVAGLPDYVMFYNDKTIWWEVKCSFGNTLNFNNHFTPAQKVVFNKMFNQGVDVNIYAISKTKGSVIFLFSEIMKKRSVKCH